MATNANLLVKGLKRLGLTLFLMFSAPIVIFEAFKNQQHPLYYPVLIVGLLIAIAAIIAGFSGIKLIVDSFFYKQKSHHS
jgi:NADH:ubiquinone oxidoreductase subunit 5 (subunit L)/multisubunit Na+/H+ antiporter MnhA subunit